MKIKETEKEKRQLIKMLSIGAFILFLSFVLPVILYLRADHSNSNNDVVKDNPQMEQPAEQEQNNTNIDTEKIIDNSSIENPNENPKDIVDNSSIPRNLNDPFYKLIYKHMSKLKQLPYNDLMPGYYPRDNYIVNAAREDGTVRVFKKNPIYIYVPQNEYYDAITQAFVTYNYQFKGLLSFKATTNPNVSDIKIIFTDKLTDLRDDERAIGLGGPKRYDKDGNISYAEIHILNKKNGGYNASLIEVYNVLLHEIGHCIGIAGHSPIINDLMFKEESYKDKTQLKSFSSRDIETIKLMYSGRTDIISSLLRNVKEDKLHENLQYAQNTNSSDSYLEVADSYYYMGKYDEALEAYKKAMQINPNNGSIYLKLGNSYIKAKKYDDALVYLKYAVQKANTDNQKVTAYDNIGYVYAMKKDYVSAMDSYYSALRIEPSNKDEFFNYIDACYHADKKDEAKEAYNAYMHYYNSEDFDQRDKQLLEWVNSSN